LKAGDVMHGSIGGIGTLVTRMAEELGEPSGVSRRVIQT